MPIFLENVPAHSRASSFRTDVAGIRGIAVMLVVLCHFEIPGFGGGFIGPDVFFVLSGYLITGLLVKEYSRNTSEITGRGSLLVAFYLRRTRRILPASLFVLLCINIYAWLNVNALQVAQIKVDSIWTVLFGANINFLRQATDYFAQNNTVSPLQHYWSLSVEEQFYFVWPVLFLAAASFHNVRFRDRESDWHQHLRAVFIALGIGSFLWMLVEFTTSPTSAYFSTFSRAWEFALGGTLSLLSVESVAAKLGHTWTLSRALALVALVGSVAVITPTNFGYTLAIPAVATGFLLISGAESKSDLTYRLLSAKPLVALGTISFSMYLWHWPVFVFGRNLGLMETLAQRFMGVFVCIALGTLSYWLVERTFLSIPLPTFKPRPNYNGRAGLATSRMFTSAVTLLVIAGLGYVTYPSNPINQGKRVATFLPQVLTGHSDADASVSDLGTFQGAVPLPKGNALKAYRHQWMNEVSSATSAARLPKDLQPAFEVLPSMLKQIWFGCDGYRYISETETKVCSAGNLASKHQVLVLGDSHAAVLWPMLMKSLDLSKWGITLLGQGGCNVSFLKPKLGYILKSKCDAHRDATFKMAARLRPELLIISESLSSYHVDVVAKPMRRAINILKPMSEHLVVVGQTIGGANLVGCATKSGLLRECHLKRDNVLEVQTLQRAVAHDADVGYFDVSSLICTKRGAPLTCPLFVGNIATYYDGDHLTAPLVQALSPFFADFLDKQGVR